MADSLVADIEIAIGGYEEGAWVPESSATVAHIVLLRQAADALKRAGPECPDRLTAGALATMIDERRIPSPWRDAGIRLIAFGKWLRQLAEAE